jgi:acetoin utilization deacetylase AcuC-like enzyme
MPLTRAWSTARWPLRLPAGHRFPMDKYRLIREGVLARRLLTLSQVEEPERADPAAVALVHDRPYVDAVLENGLDADALRRLGFPWSPELPERSLRTVQGTLEAMRDALAHGAGANLAGGTHHAHAGHGEGFCVFNDVAVGLRVLLREGAIRRAAVVDLDVHQGNGTARIFTASSEVFTFSMHGARNYPFRKERSDLDVELADGCDDAGYLLELERHLDRVLDGARPDLVVYLAGADPYGGDRLGRLRLSIEGLRRRDALVFAAARARGLPVVMVLGGGYARDLADVVAIHANTVAELRVAYG